MRALPLLNLKSAPSGRPVKVFSTGSDVVGPDQPVKRSARRVARRDAERDVGEIQSAQDAIEIVLRVADHVEVQRRARAEAERGEAEVDVGGVAGAVRRALDADQARRKLQIAVALHRGNGAGEVVERDRGGREFVLRDECFRATCRGENRGGERDVALVAGAAERDRAGGRCVECAAIRRFFVRLMHCDGRVEAAAELHRQRVHADGWRVSCISGEHIRP